MRVVPPFIQASHEPPAALYGRPEPITPVVAPGGAATAYGRSEAHATAAGDAPQALVVTPGADARALELHYSLDPVARIWVADIVDPATGEVLRSVPATHVLRRAAPAVDTRA